MNGLFPNQDFGRTVLKHKNLPIYKTDEFDFYRCICFNDSFYGKTVSELHRGNLRQATPENRYSRLFPNEKISYWADSPQTARAEVKYHNHTNNLLTFWAYDDATSTFHTIDNDEPLIIIDGRETGFSSILSRVENEEELDKREKELIKRISELKPDCLIYKSLRKVGGLNYLFFEKGFNKLSIREVRLRLGDLPGKNKKTITCAVSSDYSPHLKNYGKYFLPLARIENDINYASSQEYISRNKIYEKSLRRIREIL